MNLRIPQVQHLSWAAAVVVGFIAGMVVRGGDPTRTTSAAAPAADRRPLSALIPTSDNRHATDIRTEAQSSGNSNANSSHSVTERFRSALAEHDPVRRMGLVSDILQTMTADEADDMLAAFGQQWRMGDYQQEFKTFLHAWGGIDGQRAVEFALDPDSPVKIDYGARAAMAGWATADLSMATGWVESLEPGQRKNAMVYGLLDGWSRNDLAGASAYAESQPRSNERTGMIDLLLSRHLEQGGTDSATAWFEGISGEGHNATYQARAFFRISQEIARDDPVATAGWIDQHAGESYVTADVMREVASAWGKAAPDQAMAWVTGSATENIEGPVQGIMESWADQDPAAAADWLRDHVDQPYYDSATQTYANHLGKTSPEQAMQWAESISEEVPRQAAVEDVARSWLQADNETARAQLLSQGMPEDQIERLSHGAVIWNIGGQGNVIHLGGEMVLSAEFSPDGSRVALPSGAATDGAVPGATIRLFNNGSIGASQNE